MFEALKSAVTRLRPGGMDGLSSPALRNSEGEATDADQSSLFQCQRCERVYVAPEKQGCSQCDAGVERVPSTLAECDDR